MPPWSFGDPILSRISFRVDVRENHVRHPEERPEEIPKNEEERCDFSRNDDNYNASTTIKGITRRLVYREVRYKCSNEARRRGIFGLYVRKSPIWVQKEERSQGDDTTTSRIRGNSSSNFGCRDRGLDHFGPFQSGRYHQRATGSTFGRECEKKMKRKEKATRKESRNSRKYLFLCVALFSSVLWFLSLIKKE